MEAIDGNRRKRERTIERQAMRQKDEEQNSEKPKQHEENEVEQNESKSSTFSFFYNMMPKDILGVPLNEIKRDLKDSTSQLSSLYVFSNKNNSIERMKFKINRIFKILVLKFK